MTETKFRADRIVYSFGVLSDWHIKTDPEPGRDNREKLISAITQLRQTAAGEDPNGLALLIAAGDMTHDGKPEEIALLRQTLERAMDFDKIAFIYVAGNHDKHNRDCNADYCRIFGELLDGMYDGQDAAPDGMLSGNRHFVLGGRHFITLDPGKYDKKKPNTFTQTTKDWLDTTLDCITAEAPNDYVFVITHLPIQDTCYGSTRGFFYATDDVTPILKKYPQVIAFGGHLHYPLNDERAVMQTDFTCFETATLSDMLIDGFDCENVRKGTKTEGNRDFAQGLLVQIDADGNIRVKRMDFWHRAEIGEAWVLDAPSADRTHLCRYTAARRTAAGVPTMGGALDVAFGETEDGVSCLLLRFAAADYDGYVRRYTVTVAATDSGETVREMGYLTDFYRYPKHGQMPSEVQITVPSVERGRYTVSVTAQDCWGNTSEPIRQMTEMP